MAFLVAGQRREPFLAAPASVLWLIAVLVAAHVGRMLLSADVSERLLIDYAFIPLRYSPNVTGPGTLLERAVPFISYMFLHADVTHLAFNCLWLLAFGTVVARRFGTVLFLLFFTICGVASALTYLALNWESAAAVIGASGAISGLMGAGIRMMRMPGPGGATTALAPIWSAQILTFSLFWIGINLLFGLTGWGAGEEVHQIAWQAHLGGYLSGLFLAGGFDSLARRNGAERSIGA